MQPAQRRRIKLVRAAPLIALTVLVALVPACGGGDSEAPETSSEKTTPPPAAESPTPEDGMPDLTGLTPEQASDVLQPILNSYNLKIDYAPSDAPSGTVFEQTPEAGSPLEPGRLYTVRVTVSE